MKEWLISVVASIILTAIITIILPNGKTSKIIKSIFSLLIMLIILSPIKNLDFGKINFESIFNPDKIVVQENYLNFTALRKTQEIEKTCVKLVEDCGVCGAKVEINYLLDTDMEFKIEKVAVNLKNSVIILDKEHIDIIEDIKTSLSKFCELSRDQVVIYE